VENTTQALNDDMDASAEPLLDGMNELQDQPLDADFGIPDDPFAMIDGLAAFVEEVDDEDDEDDEEFRRQQRDAGPSINEGDFVLPEQQYLFKRLKTRIRQACNVNSKANVRKLALEWIFVPSQKDAANIEFGPACQALGARPIVMQARTMHQLWRASIQLSDPLPFLSIPPPISLMSEIEAKIDTRLAPDLAREIWFWPSIPAITLRAKFANTPIEQYRASLDGLIAEGYVAVSSARAYFISRNPTILSKAARERFSFSSAIYGA